MKNNLYKAFTLVELIVVITILAVLATVAFISFQGYTSSSRDSVRLADLKNISKSFEINRTKDIDFPLPDKKVDISSSGTIFQYQGELSQNILEKNLNIFDGGLDPVTKNPYGYAVNTARNKFQIIGFLENSENIANISQNTTFADNTDKYVKSSGDRLGILLDETTNDIIVQSGSMTQIDIENNTQNYGVVIDKLKKGDNNYIKNNLSFRVNIIESCRAILLNGSSQGDGIYFINPTGIDGEEFEVYCDMKTDGGGWTLIYANSANTQMLVKKSYMEYFSELGGIDFSKSNFNDYNLHGFVNYIDIPSKELLAIDIGGWDNENDYAKVSFNSYELLTKFIDQTIVTRTNEPLADGTYQSWNCENLPNNQSFQYNTSWGVNYTYNKMSHRFFGSDGNYYGLGWGDCRINDGISIDFEKNGDYAPEGNPRHFFYNVIGKTDTARVRGIAGFNSGNPDSIARYFIR